MSEIEADMVLYTLIILDVIMPISSDCLIVLIADNSLCTFVFAIRPCINALPTVLTLITAEFKSMSFQ